MIYEMITLNNLNEILYVNENSPVLRRSFGRLKNYIFLQKYIPMTLLEYRNSVYDTTKIWGKMHAKSSLSKLINKDFIPKLFHEQVFDLLSTKPSLITELKNNINHEWLELQGDKLRLQEVLRQINELNQEVFGSLWMDYIYSDHGEPSIILTILFLYAILNEKALLLYECPSVLSNISINTLFPDSERFSASGLRLSGSYDFVYYSAMNPSHEVLIYSKLVFLESHATLYNNYDPKSNTSEYDYEGTCLATSNGYILHMKNTQSDEYITISLIKSTGNIQRYLGLILALSVTATPVCTKVACFKSDVMEKVNPDILYKILHSDNNSFRKDLLTYEESYKLLFFSNALFK